MNRRWLISAVLLSTSIGCDQLSKRAAAQWLEGHAAFGTVARVVLADLGVHRTGVDRCAGLSGRRLRWRWRCQWLVVLAVRMSRMACMVSTPLMPTMTGMALLVVEATSRLGQIALGGCMELGLAAAAAKVIASSLVLLVVAGLRCHGHAANGVLERSGLAAFGLWGMLMCHGSRAQVMRSVRPKRGMNLGTCWA